MFSENSLPIVKIVRGHLDRGEIIPKHLIEQLLHYYASHPEVCVRQFHETFGLEIQDYPTWEVSERTLKLRPKLIKEEYREYMDAIDAKDLVEMFDAIIDLVYVLYGTAISHGLPINMGMLAVQDSNMSKLDENGVPIVREDGKILKGPNFFKPHLKELLDAYENPDEELARIVGD